MSKRILSNWLESFLYYVEESESCDEHKKWTGLSTLASAIERKVFIDWDHLTTIYPNLFVAIVGESGDRKTTVMGPAVKLLKQVEGVILTPKSITKVALIHKFHSINDTKMNDPTVIDTQQNGELHTSVTAFCSELINFVGSHYRDERFAPVLCELYDCEPEFSHETKGDGLFSAPNVCLNLIGGLTVKSVHSAFPTETENGLLGRFVFVYGTRTERVVMATGREKMELLGKSLVHDLQVIHRLEGPMILTPGFIEAYSKWYLAEDHCPGLKSIPALIPYINRKATHVRKLAMLLSLSRNDLMEIHDVDFELALEFLKQTEKSMSLTFGSYGEHQFSQFYKQIVTIVKENQKISLPDLYEYFMNDMDRPQLERLIVNLAGISNTNIEFKTQISGVKKKKWIFWKENKPLEEKEDETEN